MPSELKPETKNRIAVVPNAAELAKYAAINPELPALMLTSRDNQLKREFRYASMSLAAGVIALVATIGGYVYLSINGHAVTSGILLGAGVLSLVGGLYRSRLDG